jgi:hypothetical protein
MMAADAVNSVPLTGRQVSLTCYNIPRTGPYLQR